jgi:hypothetical protein
MGISNSEATTARLIERVDSFDFILHVGDFGCVCVCVCCGCM